MKRLAFLTGLLVLAWCVPATADWLKGCREGGVFTDSLGGTGKIACHAPATATDSPSPIQVGDCDQVDIFWYPDRNGSGADSAGQAAVYTCPSTASASFDADGDGNVNDAVDWRLMCQPLDGGTVLNAVNTEAEGWGAFWLWFDVTGVDEDPELMVKCNVGP
jgi:hypothetical protein